MAESKELTSPTPKVEDDEEKKKTKKKHNSLYYARHREEVRERLRKRYLEDPDYREKVKREARECNKRRYHEKREALKAQALKYVTPNIYKVCLPDGQEITTEMFTTGHLGMRLGVTMHCIARWEARGLIPKAMYRNLQNKRLYTAYQVEAILKFYNKAIHNFGLRTVKNKISKTSFFRQVTAFWKDYPYGVEEHRGPSYAKDAED